MWVATILISTDVPIGYIVMEASLLWRYCPDGRSTV